MNRVTILCYTNVSDSDKKKPVKIGKYAKPRCFKGTSKEYLPVTYFSNRNAWMTSAIFTE